MRGPRRPGVDGAGERGARTWGLRPAGVSFACRSGDADCLGGEGGYGAADAAQPVPHGGVGAPAAAVAWAEPAPWAAACSAALTTSGYLGTPWGLRLGDQRTARNELWLGGHFVHTCLGRPACRPVVPPNPRRE